MLSTLRQSSPDSGLNELDDRVQKNDMVKLTSSFKHLSIMNNCMKDEFEANPTHLIVGITAHSLAEENVLYVFSYYVGSKVMFSTCELRPHLPFGGIYGLCFIQLSRIMTSFVARGLTPPEKIYVFRYAEFATTYREELEEETGGLTYAVECFFEDRPEKEASTFVTTVSPGNFSWAHFVFNGENNYVYSYMTIEHPSIWDSQEIIELAWSLTNQTGFIQLCAKSVIVGFFNILNRILFD